MGFEKMVFITVVTCVSISVAVVSAQKAVFAEARSKKAPRTRHVVGDLIIRIALFLILCFSIILSFS